MYNTSSLRDRLESTYDLPFHVESGTSYGDIWYIIQPQSNDEQLFSIKANVRNSLRLIMEFEPHRYGGNLIHSMGLADEEQKILFSSYAHLINTNRGKIELHINQIGYDALDYLEWPTDWTHIHIRVTVFPLSDQDSLDDEKHKTIIDEWCCTVVGLILSLLEIVPLDKSEQDEVGYEEGSQCIALINKYERNPINRFLCLKIYGYKCNVCQISFEKTYGDIGKGYIHVHHIIPVSNMGAKYMVDPVKELIPVCPNCHAMLHITNPPLSTSELRKRLEETRSYI
jgi:5-methylcytosine-specific restriction protein A